jgi:predicted GNAT family N-acyltransferase/uncharacterized protein YndB with AHSA1/START domain
MTRTDTASRTIAAPLDRVYAALVDPEALAAWLPPTGMSGWFEHFDARPGGSYRLVLTYADASTAPGKATADSDITEARFVEIVPGVRVVQAVEFVSEDPAYAGTMAMTWEVNETEGGTRVDMRADDVPSGISAEDHAAGMASSLANLDAYVQQGSEEGVTWSDVAGPDLDVATLYDVLVLRSAVFVVEQNCAYQDLDGRDLLEGTRHLIGRQGTIAAYARILAPEAVPEHGLAARGESSPDLPTPRIGRVIVAPQARGQQLGRRVIERAVRSCEQHWPGQPIELGAQAHLVALYGSVGFAPVGGGFVEDGIPHQWMRREA